MSNKTQVIHIAKLKERVVFKDNTDVFSFRKDKKHHWLQKLCFKILKRIGAYGLDESVSVSRITIDTKKVIDSIIAQRGMLEMSWQFPPSHIYMGPEDYASLMKDESFMFVTQPLSFTGSVEFGSTKMPEKRIMDIPFTIIPYMKGVLMVPEYKKSYEY